jgi:hypothetical protein
MKLKGNSGQILTIERAGFGEPGTPGEEDLLLNVTVEVGGYSAADQAWIMADDWRKFMNELIALEKIRKGQATLHGASPDDLKLTFEVIDAAGHMAVTGFLGWNTPDGYYQRFEFGFQFDAGLLGTVVHELGKIMAQNND